MLQKSNNERVKVQNLMLGFEDGEKSEKRLACFTSISLRESHHTSRFLIVELPSSWIQLLIKLHPSSLAKLLKAPSAHSNRLLTYFLLFDTVLHELLTLQEDDAPVNDVLRLGQRIYPHTHATSATNSVSQESSEKSTSETKSESGLEHRCCTGSMSSTPGTGGLGA